MDSVAGATTSAPSSANVTQPSTHEEDTAALTNTRTSADSKGDAAEQASGGLDSTKTKSTDFTSSTASPNSDKVDISAMNEEGSDGAESAEEVSFGDGRGFSSYDANGGVSNNQDNGEAQIDAMI